MNRHALMAIMHKVTGILRIAAIAASVATIAALLFVAFFFRADFTFQRASLPNYLKRTSTSFDDCGTEGCMPGLPAWNYTYEITGDNTQGNALPDIAEALRKSGFEVDSFDDKDSDYGPSLNARIRDVTVTVSTKQDKSSDSRHIYISATNN